jgi:hypothetical protein
LTGPAILRRHALQRAGGKDQVLGDPLRIVAAQFERVHPLEQERTGCEIDDEDKGDDRKQPLGQPQATNQGKDAGDKPADHQPRFTSALNM